MAYLVFADEAAASAAAARIAENLGVPAWSEAGAREGGGFFLPQPPEPAMDGVKDYALAVTVHPAGAPAPCPESVTNSQTRRQLLRMPGRAGGPSLFAEVDAALKAGGAQTEAFQTWEYNNQVFRNDALTQAIALNFGFTEAEIDEMFRQAAAL